jgi:hypothetical protein
LRACNQGNVRHNIPHSATVISKTSMVKLVLLSDQSGSAVVHGHFRQGSSWAGSCKSLRNASRDKEQRHVGNGRPESVFASPLVSSISFLSRRPSRVFLCASTSSFDTRTAAAASFAVYSRRHISIKTSTFPRQARHVCFVTRCNSLALFETITLSSQESVLDTTFPTKAFLDIIN